MNRRDAETLWGVPMVSKALSCRVPPADLDLHVEMKRHASTDAGFARWARTLPWPSFCAVVHLVAGVTRAELLTMGEIRE
jgi:hypothetical protein